MTALVTAMPGPGERGVTVIRLAGQFDMGNIVRVQEETAAALRHGDTRVVLDLRAVEFLDSTMLNAVIDLDRRSRRSGGRLVVVRPAPRVWRVFRVTGLDRRLASEADLKAAISRLGNAPES